jgi:3-keto-5-aminohexanoate cleavage enzyme
MTPLVLMVAPNGARRGKADHPHLPMTPGEIAREAALCCEAGATVLHLHVRTSRGEHALDPVLYRETIRAVRHEIGDRMVIQTTTEAVGRYAPKEQMQAVRELHPEAVSLGLRELIPEGGDPAEAAAFFRWLRDEKIAPQYILYTPSEVADFQALRRQGVIPQARPFVLFVLGRYGDAPTEVCPRDLLGFLDAFDPGLPWALCAFGAIESACVLTAAGLGGHARVGFENNLWLADGALAGSNADLVAQARTALPLLGREPADIETTRALLAETAA